MRTGKKFPVAILTLISWLCLNSSFIMQAVQSSGMLHFKSNGRLFVADNTHARAYAIQQNSRGYLKAANKDDMIIDVQWNNMRAAGEYQVTLNNGTAAFTVMHKTYGVTQEGDHVKILVNSIKNAGAFILLQGRFEARLHDKNGNELVVSDGRFETYTLSEPQQ
ncbi:MAG: hypothetical protein U0V75_09025 [Ferruginibacter sp.]